MVTPASRSHDIAAGAISVIPGGASSAFRRTGLPLAIRRAEGAWLEDADGNRLINYHAAFGRSCSDTVTRRSTPV